MQTDTEFPGQVPWVEVLVLDVFVRQSIRAHLPDKDKQPLKVRTGVFKICWSIDAFSISWKPYVIHLEHSVHETEAVSALLIRH